MMMAKMQEDVKKHFCHEDDVDYTENFTSEPEKLSEAAGLSFEQNTPTHLRGLKDFEIEFVLSQKKIRRA